MDRLSPADQGFVELRYFCGFRCEPISRQVGWPIDQVRSRLVEINQRIRELLNLNGAA